MQLSLAISTCPNDTFAFDALINGRIDRQGYLFNPLLTDIDVLNGIAASAEPDIIKLSYAAYPFVSQHYQMLTAGSAIGNGVGPLVVSKRKVYPDELPFVKVAIPGHRTTANLLFSLFFPSSTQKKVYTFSDIEEVILSNEADAGVIIHENRFTYQQKGLQRIADLGEMWEMETLMPIPLGGIAIKRELPLAVKLSINELVKKSVEFALASPTQSRDFVSKHAQEMDENTQWRHIELYVNSYSVDVGEQGKKAISLLWDKAALANFGPSPTTPSFVK